jgi:hypothetical protein
VRPGDFIYELGIRSGDKGPKVRAFDPVTYGGVTPWYELQSVADLIAAYDALAGYGHIKIRVDRPSVAAGKHVMYVTLMDCGTGGVFGGPGGGVSCPTP